MDDRNCKACRDGVAPPVPFSMAFQPVIDTHTKSICAYEALVRGPSGEGAGSILSRIDAEKRYSFDQSCRVTAIELAARLRGASSARLNINFMPNAVYEPRACVRLTLEAAERCNFPLDLITFEITEDERIRDHAHLRSIIDEYRRHKFRVALDDFGSGYSGLNVLADLMPDYVKLDRAIVQDVDKDPVRRAIALGMVGVCQTIGVAVVAEGVETMQELEVFQNAGVHLFQGFLFARPAFEKMVTSEEISVL